MEENENTVNEEEVFFMEQADGTWHKMRLPHGVERKLENAVFEGRYRTIDTDLKKNPKLFKEMPEEAEFFFAKGEFIPEMIWVVPIPEKPNS